VHGEQGSTLLELLMATAIMGIAVVTMLVGMTTLFTTSAANRQSTTAGIVARDYAEALNVWVAQTGVWCPTTYSVPAAYYTPPLQYVPSAVGVGICPTSGPLFEPVTITVTEPSGATETLKTVVRQP
jgi:hypothetical protein